MNELNGAQHSSLDQFRADLERWLFVEKQSKAQCCFLLMEKYGFDASPLEVERWRTSREQARMMECLSKSAQLAANLEQEFAVFGESAMPSAFRTAILRVFSSPNATQKQIRSMSRLVLKMDELESRVRKLRRQRETLENGAGGG